MGCTIRWDAASRAILSCPGPKNSRIPGTRESSFGRLGRAGRQRCRPANRKQVFLAAVLARDPVGNERGGNPRFAEKRFVDRRAKRRLLQAVWTAKTRNLSHVP